MYNVLIVDEEEHLLWALEQNLFPDRDDIEIVTANNGEEGLERLEDGPVDLLVSDIKMPGTIDGFQLILRAKEVAPDARVIIMTAFGTNRIQNFADRIGITHYIEKPFNTSELRDAILEILDEKEGFQGVLSDLELTDIIQMLCLARRTALLHLKHKDHRGKIVFESGEVTHAEFDGITGDDAVFSMLALRQGDIFMQSDFENDERTVELGWQDLLFEGIKRADEERHRAAMNGEVSEAEDDSGPHTDPGMGVSTEQVDEMIEEAGLGLGMEPSQSFFSEAEIAEIEAASEDAMEASPSLGAVSDSAVEEEVEEPVGSLQQVSESVMVAGQLAEASEPSVVAEEVGPNGERDEDFQTPFRVSDTHEGITPVRDEDSDGEEPDADLDNLTPQGFHDLLNEFALECPGLRLTGIFAANDGLALSFVRGVDGAEYDPEAIAAFFGDVVQGARRTVEALHDRDHVEELQIELGGEFVLMRVLEGTSYLHVAFVEKDVSLGVALVLMRRFQKKLLNAVEGS